MDKNKDILEEFKKKLNAYDMSKDAIDDDNGMLRDLIDDCKALILALEGLEKEGK